MKVFETFAQEAGASVQAEVALVAGRYLLVARIFADTVPAIGDVVFTCGPVTATLSVSGQQTVEVPYGNAVIVATMTDPVQAGQGNIRVDLYPLSTP